MLDSDTKRRIDTARDILVGKVPDPKSQVEQITIALIYKFMDDMDAEAAELGGKRKFFTGEFASYGWAQLMKKAGNDKLLCYSEGITKMTENEKLPELFRSIFKNAYLPYRDPETLNAFLKIIDEFSYDHSERLGDAFEYLLSVLGSQGDAGQFRTPRHIIDFMVEVLAPQKHETILDPACGTAGFLISAYKHILKKHNPSDPANRADPSVKPLTPDEKGRLAKNFKGYDISPDMVRLSLVNLYLHGFTDPHIYEYDSLTSEERWNEFADVILANPPFMSPKGGIKPHKRFSIQAKRSEVLFVDYMAEHLTAKGRAAIIVPEGIIFQSQTAYKELRKMLVENSLVAVISLPAGCFNPYSGVKTSILILDKSLAKQSDTIAFFKVENDGFGLGAQRRAIEKNDLPQVQVELAAYLQALRSGSRKDQTDQSDLSKNQTDLFNPLSTAQIVPKAKLAANGDYNLSGERYREGAADHHSFPMRPLGEIAEIQLGKMLDKTKHTAGTLMPYLRNVNVQWGRIDTHDLSEMYFEDDELEKFSLRAGDVLVCEGGEPGRAAVWDGRLPDLKFQKALHRVRFTTPFEPVFFVHILQWFSKRGQLESQSAGAGIKHLPREVFARLEIPVVPLEVQKEIVAEIEGYQKVINGARAVLDHYRPHIPIHPDWPMVPLEEACDIQRGKFSHRPRNEPRFYGGEYPFIQTGDIVRAANGGKITFTQTLNEEGLSVSKLFQPPVVVITIAANIGDTAVLDFPSCFPDSVVALIPKSETDARYLEVVMRTKKQHLNGVAPQAAQKNINIEILKTVEIPLPPLATQQAIVAEIEAEQALVAANRELITRFEHKIQATLARIWGAAPSTLSP